MILSLLFLCNILLAQTLPNFQPPALSNFIMPALPPQGALSGHFPFFRGNVFWPLGANSMYNYSWFNFPKATQFELMGEYSDINSDDYYDVKIRSVPEYSSRSYYKDESYYIKGSILSGLTANNGVYTLTSDTDFYQRQEIQNRNLDDEICTDCQEKTSKTKKDSLEIDSTRLALVKNKILKDKSVPKKAFLNAWNYFMKNQNKVRNKNYITVVDYNLPSTQPRLFLINLKNGSVEKHMVSHGVNSSGYGENVKYALQYSNGIGDNTSSKGAYLTGETYSGRFNGSMRLDGQQSYNSNARKRNIVVHPFKHVTSSIAGLTEGCFGLSPKESEKIINKTKNGSVWYVEPYSA